MYFKFSTGVGVQLEGVKVEVPVSFLPTGRLSFPVDVGSSGYSFRVIFLLVVVNFSMSNNIRPG